MSHSWLYFAAKRPPLLDGEDLNPVPVETKQSDTTGERPLLDEKYTPWTLPLADFTSPPVDIDATVGAPFTYKW
jgi:hypothetical protein